MVLPLLLVGKVAFSGNAKIDIGYITCTHTSSGVESDTYKLMRNEANELCFGINLEYDNWLSTIDITSNAELLDDSFMFHTELISTDNNIFITTSKAVVTTDVLESALLEHYITITEDNRLTHGPGNY